MPRLFLDADGVLADFDLSACQLLGMKPKEYIGRHGRGAFWSRLAKAKNFYGALPEMPDARVLFDAVKHLRPTILTGLPVGKWAAPEGAKSAPKSSRIAVFRTHIVSGDAYLSWFLPSRAGQCASQYYCFALMVEASGAVQCFASGL